MKQLHHQAMALIIQDNLLEHLLIKPAYLVLYKVFWQEPSYYRCNLVKKSHPTIPILTTILNECLVPNCGISMQPSTVFITASSTPFTSFPNTKAYFLSFSGLKSSKLVLFSACSIAKMV